MEKYDKIPAFDNNLNSTQEIQSNLNQINLDEENISIKIHYNKSLSDLNRNWKKSALEISKYDKKQTDNDFYFKSFILDKDENYITFHSKEKKYCFYFLFIIPFDVILILLKFQLIFHVLKTDFNIYEIEKFYFQDILNNWLLTPIEEISIDCDNSPTGLDKNNNLTYLINDYWMGVKEGCICGQEIIDEKCKNENTNCQSIKPPKEKQYSSWQQKKICAARKSYGNYFELDIQKNKEECCAKSKSCGIIDSLGNHLCVLKEEKCPVNYLKILKKDELNSGFINITEHKENINFDDGTNHLKLNTNFSLIYGNFDNKTNMNQYIIPIKFKVDFGIPCKNPYFINNNFSTYKLDKHLNRNKCFFYLNDFNNYFQNDETIQTKFFKEDSNNLIFDKNYHFLDSLNTTLLYSANGILTDILNLPKYPIDNLSNNSSLFYRNFFGLNVECIDHLKNTLKVDELKKELENLIEYKFFPNYYENKKNFFIAYSFILPILIVAYFIKFFFLYFENKISNNTKGNLINLESTFIVQLLIIIMSLIPINKIEYDNYEFNGLLTSVFYNSTCVENYTFQMFDNIVKKYQISQSNLIFMYYSTIFYVMFFIAYVVFYLRFISKNKSYL